MPPFTRVAIAGDMLMVHRDGCGRIVWRHHIPNGVTTQGANHLNDVVFKGGTKITAWALGLIEGLTYGGVSANDTHGSHPTWQEFTAVGATRPTWATANAAAGSTGHTVQSFFPILSNGFIRGAFVASRFPVGDVSSGGILYATAVAVANLPVFAAGTVSVGYVVSAQ